ncbi:MAG TPA: hypothetical protein VN428_03900 [Bryobacteraceae bacterium]|nr:hypothetical protein [Bryobacteraceae bacterium]
MTVAEITRIVGWVLWCMTAAYGVLAFRLWSTGLFRRYPFFFGFIAFRVARALVLSALPIYSSQYGWVWFFTQPVLWLLYILVVFELFGLVLESYKGLATVGRWALMVGLGLAVAIAALSLGADLSSESEYPLLRYWTVIDRGVQSSLVLFLLFITLFLAWYPIKLSRNVVVHSIVYAAYFVTGASGVLIRNFWGGSALIAEAVNLGLSSATLLCLIAWSFLLKPSGEHVTIAKRPQWSAADEAHLIAQLSSINASLLRAARK